MIFIRGFRSLKFFSLRIFYCGTSLEFESGSMPKLEHLKLNSVGMMLMILVFSTYPPSPRLRSLLIRVTYTLQILLECLSQMP